MTRSLLAFARLDISYANPFNSHIRLKSASDTQKARLQPATRFDTTLD